MAVMEIKACPGLPVGMPGCSCQFHRMAGIFTNGLDYGRLIDAQKYGRQTIYLLSKQLRNIYFSCIMDTISAEQAAKTFFVEEFLR